MPIVLSIFVVLSLTISAQAFTNDAAGIEVINATQELFNERPVNMDQAQQLARRYEALCDRTFDPAVRRWCLHQLVSNAYAYYWVYTDPSLLLSERSEDVADLDSAFLRRTRSYLQDYLAALDVEVGTVGDSVLIIGAPAEWRLSAPAEFVLKHAYIRDVIDYEVARRQLQAGRWRARVEMERALGRMSAYIEWRFAATSYQGGSQEQRLFNLAYVRSYIARTLALVSYPPKGDSPDELRAWSGWGQLYAARLQTMIHLGARLAGQAPEDFAAGVGAGRYFTPLGERGRQLGAAGRPRLAVSASYYAGWRRLAQPLAGSPKQKSAHLDSVCGYFERAAAVSRRQAAQLDVLLAAAGKLSKGEERQDKKCLFERAAKAYEVAPEDQEVRNAFYNYVDFVWSSARELDPQRRHEYAKKIARLAPEVARELDIRPLDIELISDQMDELAGEVEEE